MNFLSALLLPEFVESVGDSEAADAAERMESMIVLTSVETTGAAKW